MTRYLYILPFIGFLASPVPAQLVLPELEDDESGPMTEIFVPGPERTGGLHAATNSPEVLPSIQKEDLELPPPVNFLPFERPEAVGRAKLPDRPGQGDSPLDGTERMLPLQVTFPGGNRINGTLRNQPLLIENLAGRLLVHLHEVKLVEIKGGDAAAMIECLNGDRVSGTLVNAHFDLRHHDGGGQRLPTTQAMRLTPLSP